MKRLMPTFLLMLALAPCLTAGAPKQPRLMNYSRLWAPSPFTAKRAPVITERESPLERDWTLGSIRPGKDGFSVTLINKKDRKDRIRFLPGFSSGDFQLLEVKQDASSYKNSRVRVRKGSQTAWIGYDEAFVKPRVAAARKPSTSKGSTKGRPPIPGKSGTSSSKKPSRPRFIPRK
ncbi:MAG: hypothetical protein ACPG32_08070 [Akkermansiaceae bacterium]